VCSPKDLRDLTTNDVLVAVYSDLFELYRRFLDLPRSSELCAATMACLEALLVVHRDYAALLLVTGSSTPSPVALTPADPP
jgi:hypothetical protein